MRPHAPHPPETRQRVVELYRGGKMPSEIARYMGMSRSTVKSWCAQADGRERPRRRQHSGPMWTQWTPEQDDEIVALRAEGLPILKIARKMERSERAVSYRLGFLRDSGREIIDPVRDCSGWNKDSTPFQTSRPTRKIWAFDRADAEAEAKRQGLEIVGER